MIYRCLFEQSGTFKNEFKKLGFEAYDYDVLNDFGETDFVTDIFAEIEKSYEGGVSIFDDFADGNNTLLAFFPCTMFEAQSNMNFRGDNCGMKNWNDIEKLEFGMVRMATLHMFYNLVSKLVIVCERKKIPLIIENPYQQEHFLTRYWCIKPKVIDMDRRQLGDYFKKPTQYWFINCEPKNNFIFEATAWNACEHGIATVKATDIEGCKNTKVARSMIHPEYANRFIRENIIDEVK